MNHPGSATPPVRQFSSARAHRADGRRVPRLQPLSLVLSLMLAASVALPVAAQQAADSLAGTAVVSGAVYDSLSGRPLAGALVQLTTSDLRGRVSRDTTNLLGSFSIADVKPGEYIIGFTHPFLDSLGLEAPPMKLRVDGSKPLQLSLAIPTPLAIRARLCPDASPADSSGLMLGFLRDADTGRHLDSGTVILAWTEVRVSNDNKSIVPVRRSATARVNRSGWYALCGVPTAGPLAAHAESGENRSGFIDVRVPARGVLHRDFDLPLGTAAVAVARADSDTVRTEARRSDAVAVRRGSSRVAGSVRDRNGKPLGGARVMVWGTDIATNARDDGSFLLDKLPAGTQTLEARHIGYAARRVVVDLSSQRTDSVTVMLDKVADVLGEVTVYGEPSALSKKLEGFRQRMRAGWGHFFTRADIQKRRPIRFTAMLQGIPGITVQPVGAFGYQVVPTVRSTRCSTTIVVDGHRLPRFLTGDYDDLNSWIWLDDVVGIEIYPHGEGAPAEYGGWGFCPVVLVWTSPDADVLDRADAGRQ
jgi:hypothetical protein